MPVGTAPLVAVKVGSATEFVGVAEGERLADGVALAVALASVAVSLGVEVGFAVELMVGVGLSPNVVVCVAEAVAVGSSVAPMQPLTQSPAASYAMSVQPAVAHS